MTSWSAEPDTFLKVLVQTKLTRETLGWRGTILQPGDIVCCLADLAAREIVRVRVGNFVGDLPKKSVRPLTPLEALAFVA